MRSPAYFDALVGQKFNRLTVLSLVKRADHKTYLVCRCDCGVERTFISCAVTKGRILSCGCLGREHISQAHTKHGHASKGVRSREYLSWSGMIARCYNPNVKGWLNWGGRGITVCGHWKDSFSQFLADMGPKPEGLTLDRRDNNLGYLCPRCLPPDGNCHWVPWSEQLKNRRRMKIGNERKIQAGQRVWESRTPEQKQACIDRLHKGWMSKTPEERHQHGLIAAAARWGGQQHAVDQ
jgi:hypothetical protein